MHKTKAKLPWYWSFIIYVHSQHTCNLIMNYEKKMTESYPTDPEMIKVIGLITITLIR